MKKNRIKMAFNIPIALIIGAFLIVSVARWDYILYPGYISSGNVFVWGDFMEKGHSEVSEFTNTGSRIRFNYMLKQSEPLTYICLVFLFKPYFNLGSYDHIEISVSSDSSRTYQLVIRSFISHYTDPEKYLTSLYHVYDIPVWQKKESYIIPVKKLTVPNWWYEINDFLEKKPDPNDLSHIMTLEILSDHEFPPGKPDTMTLEKIRFYRDKNPVFILLLLIMLIYFIVIITIYALNKRKFLIIPYRKAEDIPADSAEGKLIRYLGENYTDPELSVKKISEDCGIAPLKIPQIIKRLYGMTFPLYMNSIRIEEAKRLLRDPDLQITEIAHAVGFNSLNHFNRLFKKTAGASPIKYRKSVNDKNKRKS